jgi:glucose-1-phosphate adenylyltransferase
LDQHARTNADLTIAAVECPAREATRFGVIEVDESFRVTGFEEKPADPRRLPNDSSKALVSMGVYVFKKTALLGCLRAFCDAGLGYDFGHQIVPALIHSARVFAYDFRDKIENRPKYWRDIGTLDGYYAANMDFVRRQTLNARFLSHNNSSHTSRGASRVHSNCAVTGSVLAPNVRIAQSAKVHESILMPGAHVGEGAQLRRAIVVEDVHIPAGFRAGLDLNHDRQHHTVTESGVVVIHETPAANKSSISYFALHVGIRRDTRKRAHVQIGATA